MIHRSQPAVFLLMAENIVDPALRFADQQRIVEQIGQRQHPIQPVRPAFPAIRIPTEPLAVCDILPELIQMPAEPVRLNAQLLSSQPSG